MNKLNEIEIIKRFETVSNSNKESTIMGIGDDCAVIAASDTRYNVITCDTLTEDTHFILNKVTPEDLAYKSLASNISDVIAMGAEPRYAFLALTFTDKIDMEWIERFANSFSELAQKYNISLLGGDTTLSSHALTISITLCGDVDRKHIKYRSSAKIGDSIFCLNPLGGAALGLHHIKNSSLSHPSVKTHYRPHLFVEESLWLAEQQSVGAMMDISDGIAKDISHITSKSDLGATIDIDKIPIYPEASIRMAIEGGEEYSPLFTVRLEDKEQLIKRFKERFGSYIYEIGTMTTPSRGIEWHEKGEKVDYKFRGYEHDANYRK